ncbi:MAG: hypothetical protein IT463_00010 [Planctomycetes bacterium]|nr:hypothetical protein [Planctomycetota bacterium]
MARLLLLLALALLVAACGTSRPQPDNGDGFAAAEDAPDAHPSAGAPRNPNAQSPLTPQEEADAALLVNRLAEATDDTARSKVLDELVALGPRYLAFLRAIDNEAVQLDLLWVVRRIEGAGGTTAEQPAPKESNGGEPGPRVTRPEYGPGEGEFDREQVELFLAARLQHARRLLEAGNYDSATRIAEAALTLLPDTRLRRDFDALILQARSGSQAELLIAGTLAFEPEVARYSARRKGAPFETPLQIRCFLKNVSAAPITLGLVGPDGQQSVLVLQAQFDQLDYQGNTMSVKNTVTLPIEADGSVTLQPGESYEIAVPLESAAGIDSDASLKYALGRLSADASLRFPMAADAQGQLLNLRPVRFAQRSVLVLPAEFDLPAVQADAVQALKTAHEKSRAQDLFMAAHLVKGAQVRAAADFLTGPDFETDPLSLQRARLRGLSAMFSTGATWDIARWRRWWQDNRLRH